MNAVAIRTAEQVIADMKGYSDDLKGITNRIISHRGEIQEMYYQSKVRYEPLMKPVNESELDFKTHTLYKRWQNKVIRRKRLLDDFILRGGL